MKHVRWEYVPPGFARQIETERDTLHQQRDELVAVLRCCLTHFERIRDQQVDPHDSPMMVQARAAIAKALI